MGKKDWMHYGRRPSGLCGAALLIASRLHAFHRSVYDVIKVVKVHESTLRKRLNEFGETRASQLSLDEFLNVDLDAMTEEQDPPSYTAARRRDKDRLTLLEMEGTDLDSEIGDLEQKIVDELEKMREKVQGKKYVRVDRDSTSSDTSHQSPSTSRRNSQEVRDTEAFITEQFSKSISDLVSGSSDKDKELMPPPKSSTNSQFPVGLGLKDTLEEYLSVRQESILGGPDIYRKPDFVPPDDPDDGELDLTGIDDDEITGYLKAKAEKEEREKQEADEAAKEGREIKKRSRKTAGSAKEKKKGGPGNATAIEAIEKIVQEKKISTKINYEVLKNLTLPGTQAKQEKGETSISSGNSHLTGQPPSPASATDGSASPRRSIFSPAAGSTSPRKSFSLDRDLPLTSAGGGRKRLASFKSPPGSPVKKAALVEPRDTREIVVESGPVVKAGPNDILSPGCQTDHDDHYDDEDLEEEDESDLGKMLSQHRGDEAD